MSLNPEDEQLFSFQADKVGKQLTEEIMSTYRDARDNQGVQ